MRGRRGGLLAGAWLLATSCLIAVAAGGQTTVASGAGSRPNPHCPKDPPPFIHDSFPQPAFRTSANGVLNTTLTAAMTNTQINGQTYTSSVYEKSYPGPTLMVCPGDTLKLALRNELSATDFPGFGMEAGMTNLHTHGFFVSPNPPQDDVFVELDPGQTYNYNYHLPVDHRPGTYWYHPHMHTQANVQETGGMEGAIIVRGGLDKRPEYRHIGQRVLVITQTALDNQTHATVQPDPTGPFISPGSQFFVNGRLNPTIPIRPGEIQRWSIFNLTANSFVNLELPGQPFHLLARDGNYVPTMQTQHQMLVSPSSRREVLVRGAKNGDVKLIAAPFPQSGKGSENPPVTLATLRSSGSPVDQKMPPKDVVRYQDLRDLPVRQRHLIVYTQDTSGDTPLFFINGETFDPGRIDQVMRLNQLNEWTIVNKTTVWHTFHIHQKDFQVVEEYGKPVNAINQQDNVSVAPNGTVKMLYLPRDFTGRFVFHCHILGHEDNGMMGTVEVRP